MSGEDEFCCESKYASELTYGVKAESLVCNHSWTCESGASRTCERHNNMFNGLHIDGTYCTIVKSFSAHFCVLVQKTIAEFAGARRPPSTSSFLLLAFSSKDSKVERGGTTYPSPTK